MEHNQNSRHVLPPSPPGGQLITVLASRAPDEPCLGNTCKSNTRIHTLLRLAFFAQFSCLREHLSTFTLLCSSLYYE